MLVHPHSQEAERALLGGLLQEPERLLELADRLRPDHFFRSDHAALYELLVRMVRSGEAVDLVTLPQRLEREQLAERCGGIPYVLQLSDHAPATANLDHYADAIQQDAARRQILKLSEEVARRAAGSAEPVDMLIERTILHLSEVARTGRADSWHPISLLLDDSVQAIEAGAGGYEDASGIPTGFAALDEMLGGLRPGQMIVVGARPAMGKTAFALNIAQSCSLRSGLPGVAVFSLEMPRRELVDRMLVSHSQINMQRLRDFQLDEHEWRALVDAADDLRRTKVFIDDTPQLTIGEVRSRTRKLKAECPELGLVVIDYLQLMRGSDPRAMTHQQVGEISQGLKALAKDVNVPVIALAQLNRDVEKRQDKRPTMADLRESGSIEQDADVILFIYRDDYYNPDSATPGEAEVIIAKQRAGSTGTIRLVWRGAHQRFDSLVEEPILR